MTQKVEVLEGKSVELYGEQFDDRTLSHKAISVMCFGQHTEVG